MYIDYAGVANTQHTQIAIFKFAIYLEKPETQLFYYAIKTRPTVIGIKLPASRLTRTALTLRN